MQKIKKFSFLFLALVVVMDAILKTRKIIAHQEGESIFYTCSMDPQIKTRQAGMSLFVIWT
jgi:Cu(I)/Ag(I) efflux system membrane fusion protein